MSYRTFALAITLMFLAIARNNGNADANTFGKRFDNATVANAAVVSQDKSVRCKNALTQPEINACAREYFRKADGELNKVYKRISAKLSSDDRTNLIEAQRAWLKYRDTHCWAERELYHGGSLAPTVEATCLEDITVARTKDLVRIYETEFDR
jgi:uncharacterized protein YecT (DUF1311 family)